MGVGSCWRSASPSFACAATPEAQEPQRAAGTLKEGVTAVLVDVVVRDKRGQPVRDLTEADFELSEDGVAQTIGSFTPIQGPPAAPKAATAAAPAPAAAAPPRLRRIKPTQARRSPPSSSTGWSLENRKRAVQAAQAYVGDKEEMQNYVGIFGIDLSLRPLVPFTRNGVAVRQALNRMATGSSPTSTRRRCSSSARRRVRRRRQPPTRRTAPRPARGRGMPARSGPRPATPGSRRCRPASCPASRKSSAISPGTSPSTGWSRLCGRSAGCRDARASSSFPKG